LGCTVELMAGPLAALLLFTWSGTAGDAIGTA